METLITEPVVRKLLGVVLLVAGIALQFVPQYQRWLDTLTPRFPALKIIESRLFQLGAGFGLVYAAISLLKAA